MHVYLESVLHSTNVAYMCPGDPADRHWGPICLPRIKEVGASCLNVMCQDIAGLELALRGLSLLPASHHHWQSAYSPALFAV